MILQMLVAASVFAPTEQELHGWPNRVVIECDRRTVTDVSRQDDAWVPGRWSDVEGEIVFVFDLRKMTMTDSFSSSTSYPVQVRRGALLYEYPAPSDVFGPTRGAYVAASDANAGLWSQWSHDNHGVGVVVSPCRRLE
jgi:hypothetical protein